MNHDEWNIVFIIRSIAGIALGLCLLLFSFWKFFAFLFSFRRRRVSPELLSNEDKLIRAAHVYSAWTTIFFVLTYMILVMPLFIVLIVSKQRKSAIAQPVVGACLWLYWLQCAIKPIIYVARSKRWINRLCRCLPEMSNENMPSCFSSRNRYSTYELRETSLEHSRRSMHDGSPALPNSAECIYPSRILIDTLTNVTRPKCPRAKPNSACLGNKC